MVNIVLLLLLEGNERRECDVECGWDREVEGGSGLEVKGREGKVREGKVVVVDGERRVGSEGESFILRWRRRERGWLMNGRRSEIGWVGKEGKLRREKERGQSSSE